jgi:putative ABC transport system permease protein
MNEIARPVALLPWAPERTGETAPAMPGPGTPGVAGLRRDPDLLQRLALPARLAWRQLRSERARLATAIAGVMFAALLVFMQLGFRAALFESATNMLGAMRADLFLVHPMTQVSFRSEQLPRARAWQALADPDVELAVPIYMAQATVRDPVSGSRRAAQLIGFDAEAGAVAFLGLDAALADALKRPDTIAFDSRSRPEFGPISQLFRERGPYELQLQNRRVQLVGLVEIGPSFAADGNIVLSETNFRRVMPRNAANTDLVALRLRKGADVAAVQARLSAALSEDVVVKTHPQLVAAERRYWEKGTSIGFIFGFGSVMGLVVGMVIVYQILFADIASHLSEYATLKAMGYSNGYLMRVVAWAACILALLGFVPSVVVTVLLYDFVATATYLPLALSLDRVSSVFLMIFGMCALAGLLAMRKLRDANPADMF